MGGILIRSGYLKYRNSAVPAPCAPENSLWIVGVLQFRNISSGQGVNLSAGGQPQILDPKLLFGVYSYT